MGIVMIPIIQYQYQYEYNINIQYHRFYDGNSGGGGEKSGIIVGEMLPRQNSLLPTVASCAIGLLPRHILTDIALLATSFLPSLHKHGQSTSGRLHHVGFLHRATKPDSIRANTHCLQSRAVLEHYGPIN